MASVLHRDQHSCINFGLGVSLARGHQLLIAILLVAILLAVRRGSLWPDHLYAVPLHRIQVRRHSIDHHLLPRRHSQQGD